MEAFRNSKRQGDMTGNDEQPIHSAAKVSRLSASTRPFHPHTFYEVIQAREQKRTPGFLDLPDTVIQQILSYLPASDLVLGIQHTCKHLHKLSRMSWLWQNLTLQYDDTLWHRYEQNVYMSFYNGLFSQTCLISKYRDVEGEDAVPGTEDCTQQLVEVKMKNRVTSLTESYIDRTPVVCHSIVYQRLVYPQLEQLVLKVYTLPKTTVFLCQHPMLRSLTIDSVCSKCCAHSVANLFNHLKSCANLQTLRLKIQKWRQPFSSLKTMWVAMKDYFQTGPTLTHLRLDIPVNDDIFTTILAHCEYLEDLQLSNGHLTRRVFKETLKSPNVSLKALRLKGCTISDYSMVHAIVQSFKHLKQLEVSLDVSSGKNWVPIMSSQWFIFSEITLLKLDLWGSLSNIQRSIQLENKKKGADVPLPKVTSPAVPQEKEAEGFRWWIVEKQLFPGQKPYFALQLRAVIHGDSL